MRDPQVPQGCVEDRAEGRQPSGMVGLRNFDEGVVITLGGKLGEESGKGSESNFYLPSSVLSPVDAPPGLPGIPITFSHPEDMYERYRQPVIVVRRDDISPAMNRWHPGMHEWRVPARGAQDRQVVFGVGTTTERTVTGYDRYESKEMAVPFDITYSLSILARHRGKGGGAPRHVPVGFEGAAGSPRNQVNQILDHVLRVFPPYCQVFVIDSLGDTRRYSAFMEAISHLDEVPDVTERVLGFAVTLRVEAELDLNDPIVERAVTQPLTIRSKVL